MPMILLCEREKEREGEKNKSPVSRIYYLIQK